VGDSFLHPSAVNAHSWAKKENETGKEEEQRLENFLLSDEQGFEKPLFFACGGIADYVSPRALVDITSRVAEKTHSKVILFIRDEDGAHAQELPREDDSIPSDIYEGDGILDVHPEWQKLIYHPDVLPESVCIISRLNYASILPKCRCAILDGGHAITGKPPSHLLCPRGFR